METLTSRLDALRPNIKELMRIGGTPGLSLGVMHQGDQVYFAGYGNRYAELYTPPDAKTVLPVCSLTKAVTSAALGILVDENKATWDTLVKDALPSLNIKDDILQNQMTIADLLCHRSGMSWGDNLIIGTDNNVLVSGNDSMEYLNSQTRLLPFRGQFAYSNLAYELAGKVIESLSNMSYFDFTPPPGLGNVGKCYNSLDNGNSAPITCIKLGDDWLGAPHAGMRSCVWDLMKLYKAFMQAFNHQFSTGETSTEGLPLKQVAELMSAKIPMDQPSKNEASYGLGWGRVQLPGRMGQIGINPDLMPNGMPIVGKGIAPRLVIFHQGSMPGALSFVALLPDTETAIVISSNALALNDVADWVGQMVLEELLEIPSPQRNDYLAAAKTSAATNLQWYPNLVTQLQKAQKHGTSPRQLDAYAGTWVGVDQGPDFWKVEFKVMPGGEVDRLCWAHDDGVPADEYKREEVGGR
ncbi:beta-lactamase/transpeptidase-like protein [Chaetomium fimeti]|uniref:Beta-lactamase/transpeptidase-like protein n=1 Tax=Chaetomium fimeti TaxID=1854472 RepID=A0AAE0HBL8_9PEZI|nr:beta-lactamase/transpeptidase-like protein [Chaetomium fimeti]